MERIEPEFREEEAMNENGIQIKKEEEYSEFLALLNSSCEQQYVPPTCIYIKEEDIVTEELVVKDPEDEEVDVENIDDHLPDGDMKAVEEFPHNMMEPLVQVETQECKQEWDAEEVVESNDTAIGRSSCPECGLRLPEGASLSRHILSHQLQRRLTCALCGQLCSSSVMLMRHLHSAHAVDMPPAGVPAASTSAEDAMAPPRRTKRPYVRRTAPVVAARVRSPGERQEYQCSQCSKMFHSRYRLETHERRHREGGLFPCMYCPKCFTRENALKTHLLKHNGSSLGSDSKQKYFQQIHFLQDMDTSRRLTGSVPKLQKSDATDIMVHKTDVQVVSYNEETPLQEDSFSEQADDERPHTYETVMAQELKKLAKKRRKKKTRPVYDLIKLTKAKAGHIEVTSSKNQKSEEFDEDYFFLMSLLPHLRVIPKHLKLITRHKLKQVLIENLATYQQFPHSLHGSRSPHKVHQAQNT